jgi:cation:H+ antiporter
MTTLANYSWVAIASLFIIMVSAGYAIRAITNYAKITGIPEHVIGLMVVSLGTSLPELFTGISASIAKQGELILGDVVGANIINLTIVFGLVLIIGRTVKTKKKPNVYMKNIWLIMLVTIIPIIMGLDGAFSRLDGVVMLIIFLLYMTTVWVGRHEEKAKLVEKVTFKKIWKDMFVFTGSLVALLLAARWFVFSATNISSMIGMPLFFLGLIFVAVGTTVPELVVNLRSLVVGHGDLAFGDIIGSVIVNMNLVLGISAIINPITFPIQSFIRTSIFMIVALGAGMAFLRRPILQWKHGIVLLIIYIAFLLTEVMITYL